MLMDLLNYNNKIFSLCFFHNSSDLKLLRMMSVCYVFKIKPTALSDLSTQHVYV